MKRICLITLLLISLSPVFSQVKFEALSFSPQYPKAGDKLTFTFTKNWSPLINDKEVEIAVYQFNDKGYKVAEPAISLKGNEYKGTVALDPKTTLIAFRIAGEKEKDVNKGEGYVIPIYNNKNQPIKEYYPIAAQLHAGYGEYLFGMSNKPEKGLVVIEEGMKVYPEAKDDQSYYSNYINAINTSKKAEAKPIILEKLQAITNKKEVSEKEYNLLVYWYGRLKMKPTADSLIAIRNVKYPNGDWKKQDKITAFYKEPNADKKRDIYKAFQTDFKILPTDSAQLITMQSQIASAYAKEKNFDAFKEWSKNIPEESRTSLYNDVSWNMAENDINLQEAKRLSYDATMWAKKQMSLPLSRKPDNMTKKEWKERMQQQYAMYADTYGFILYKLGDYKEGLPYAKDGAEINKLKNAEYNERYALLLEKAAPTSEAKKIIAKFVEDGAASSKTKAVLKNLYIKENKSEDGFTSYLTKLEQAARDRKTEAVAKSIINEPSPNFVLRDLEGKEVSLKNLEGKVLVVDFWATWCGPCIASMPAMQLAQEKLKERNDVMFLFVNTWESADNKKQNAADFITKAKYPFTVLLDDENKMVEDYKVNGIPTKFVIDKNGKTRFRSVGYSGNNDDLVHEVLTMVEMASK